MNEMKPFFSVFTATKTTATEAGPIVFESKTMRRILIAHDEAGARESLMAEGCGKWPANEGWIGQEATAEIITRDQAREILACYPDLATNEPEGFTM